MEWVNFIPDEILTVTRCGDCLLVQWCLLTSASSSVIVQPPVFMLLSSPCPADNKDVSVMMSEMDVNAIAGTLKLYFRELPEPLFTDELYPNFAGGISESMGYWHNSHMHTTYYQLKKQSSKLIIRVIVDHTLAAATSICLLKVALNFQHITAPFFSLFQPCLIVLPKRAACWTYCCRCQNPTWSHSFSFWITWRGMNN